RWLAQPPVEQPLQPFRLVAIAIAPELPLRHAQQFARLHHRQRAALPAAQHIPKLLHPCGPVATLSGSSSLLLRREQNRTTRVLPNPDDWCACDTDIVLRLDPHQPRLLSLYTHIRD